MTGKRTTRAAAAAFAAGLACLSAPASAEPPKPVPQASSDQRAKDLFLEGDAAYAEGRYDAALKAFSEAYELSGRHQLLFNIGNCHERLGHLQEAADALDKYLVTGKARDKDVIQKRVANLRVRAEEQRQQQAAAEAKRHEDEERRRREDEARRGEGGGAGPIVVSAPGANESPSKVAPIVLVGTGVALAGAGAVFGVLALGARSDVEAGCRDADGGGRLCSSDAKGAIGRDATFSLLADVGIGVGVVAGAIGAVWLVTSSSGTEEPKRASRARPTLDVASRPGGAELRLGGTF